jgi:hypothetical protein
MTRYREYSIVMRASELFRKTREELLPIYEELFEYDTDPDYARENDPPKEDHFIVEAILFGEFSIDEPRIHG